MQRIVVDTNCLIQIIPHRSQYNALWQAIRRGRYSLCVSTEILEEYEEILAKLANTEVARVVLEAIINNPGTVFLTPYYKFGLIKADADDNKFVDCAIVGHAKFIVTEDKHYNILRSIAFPKVEIIDLDAFMQDYLYGEELSQ